MGQKVRQCLFHCLLEGKEYCLIFTGVPWLTHSWKADFECLSLVIFFTLKRTSLQWLDPNMDHQFVSTGTSVLHSHVTALSSLRFASKMVPVGLSVCVRLSRKSHALLCRFLYYLLKKMISFIVFFGTRRKSVRFQHGFPRLKEAEGKRGSSALGWWSSALCFSQLLPEKALCLC